MKILRNGSTALIHNKTVVSWLVSVAATGTSIYGYMHTSIVYNPSQLFCFGLDGIRQLERSERGQAGAAGAQQLVRVGRWRERCRLCEPCPGLPVRGGAACLERRSRREPHAVGEQQQQQ